MDVKEMSSLSLAFVGDAHFGLTVKEYLVNKSDAKPQQLQKKLPTLYAFSYFS